MCYQCRWPTFILAFCRRLIARNVWGAKALQLHRVYRQISATPGKKKGPRAPNFRFGLERPFAVRFIIGSG